MKTRRLGRDGPEVSALGLGCMGMSGSYGASDDGEARATLDRAIELGVTFLDTADVYGAGHNETFLGAALRGRRNRVFLATKFGNVWGQPGTPGTPGLHQVDGSPAYAAKACEDSLGRLGTDVIDLYYLHRVDSAVPIEDTVGAMARLVEAGKVRYIGLSEAATETIRRAHRVHPIAALQSEYSLFARDPEAEHLATCRELGIGFVPFSPLSRGLLSGGFAALGPLAESDMRRRLPRFEDGNIERNLDLVGAVVALAEERGLCPRPDRARLGDGPGRGHRRHPRNAAAALPRGERGRRGDRPFRGRTNASRRGAAAGRRRRRALPRGDDAPGQPVAGSPRRPGPRLAETVRTSPRTRARMASHGRAK